MSKELHEIYVKRFQYVENSKMAVGLKLMSYISYTNDRNCFLGKLHQFGTKFQAFKNILLSSRSST